MPFTTCKDCGFVGQTDQDEFDQGGPFQCDDCYTIAESKHILTCTDAELIGAGFDDPPFARMNARFELEQHGIESESER